MKRSKSIYLAVSLAVVLLAILLADHWLTRSGRQLLPFKTELPQGITIKFDRDGYKFLEDGFIHVLDEGTVLDKDTVQSIIGYGADEDDVFIEVETTRRRRLRLNIHILERNTDEISYNIRKSDRAHVEEWVELPTGKNLHGVVLLRNMLIIFAGVLVVENLFVYFKGRG